MGIATLVVPDRSAWAARLRVEADGPIARAAHDLASACAARPAAAFAVLSCDVDADACDLLAWSPTGWSASQKQQILTALRSTT